MDKIQKIRIFLGDITTLPTDVIVNASNSRLGGDGGVDRAIHQAGGPRLVAACKEIADEADEKNVRPCPTGEVRITGGFNLPCRYVFHTVGPIIQDQPGTRDAQLLSNCYRNCLELLKTVDARTISFPCISTGVYGYPNVDAATVATSTILKWLDDPTNYDSIDQIILCCFLPKDTNIFHRLLFG